MTNPNPGDLEAAAAARVPVVCCPRTNYIPGDGIPPLNRFIRLEVPLGLGLDRPGVFKPGSTAGFIALNINSRIIAIAWIRTQ